MGEFISDTLPPLGLAFSKKPARVKNPSGTNFSRGDVVYFITQGATKDGPPSYQYRPIGTQIDVRASPMWARSDERVDINRRHRFSIAGLNS